MAFVFVTSVTQGTLACWLAGLYRSRCIKLICGFFLPIQLCPVRCWNWGLQNRGHAKVTFDGKKSPFVNCPLLTAVCGFRRMLSPSPPQPPYHIIILSYTSGHCPKRDLDDMTWSSSPLSSETVCPSKIIRDRNDGVCECVRACVHEYLTDDIIRLSPLKTKISLNYI